MGLPGTPTPPRVELSPRTGFLIGVDSDGCAFDSMEIKHKECFIPATVRAWDLQPVSSLARETAEFVNLYSTSRGQNRWIALLRTLDLLRRRPEVAGRGVTVPDPAALRGFVTSGLPLSDAGLRAWADEHPHPDLERGLAWSADVNAEVERTVHGVPPFPGVLETLTALREHADLAVVSATPADALEREWGEHGLAPLVDVVGGQELGTKARQLEALAGGGRYAGGHVLLVGDAPGDRDAAAEYGALYFPVVPGREAESWRRLRTEGIARLLDGSFAGEYQDALIAEFDASLPSTPPWPLVPATAGDAPTTEGGAR